MRRLMLNSSSLWTQLSAQQANRSRVHAQVGYMISKREIMHARAVAALYLELTSGEPCELKHAEAGCINRWDAANAEIITILMPTRACRPADSSKN
eukprot:1159094-Pelagomonas_calceolata.AAC.8